LSSISPSQSDIASQILAALNVAEPDLDTSVGTTARKIIDSVANQISGAYADNNVSAASNDVTNLTGTALDNYVAGFGMARFSAKNATGLVIFSRPPSLTATPLPDVTIPGGTIIATTDTNPITFSVMFNAVLPSADLNISVPVVAVAGGNAGNVAAGNISVISTPVAGVSSVSNPLAMTGGADAESDQALIARFQATNFRGFTGTTANLVGVALETPAVSRVNAIGARTTTMVQVQITGSPGTGTTQPIEWPYIYSDNMFFGPDIVDGNMLNPTSQYTATITLDGGTGLYYIAISVVTPTYATVTAVAAPNLATPITASNNTFQFGPPGAPVTYTVAPGTYTTIATLQAAMNVAASPSGPLNSVINITNNGTDLIATSVASGPASNGLAFEEGTGFLALSGFGVGQGLAGGSGAPNGIYELQYDYLSPWTRNSVANHILNDVDIWTDGTDYQEATETLPFGVGSGAPAPAGTFTATTGQAYTIINWIRADGITHPTAGNFFIPLTFVPPAALPSNLFDGIHNGPLGYQLGTDYWLVYQTGATGWSPQSLAGIEWLASDLWGATGNWTMAVEYYYNAVPSEIETDLAGQSLAGTQNVWAHQANEMYLNFTMVVVLVPGYTYSSVSPAVEAALTNVCQGITFTETMDISEIIAAVQNVNGVQAVRMATNATSSTNLGDLATTVAAGSNGVVLSTWTVAAPGTLALTNPLPIGWPTSGVVQIYSGTTTLTWMANVFYSAVAGSSLTGCITMLGGGTLATGNIAQGPYNVQQVTAPIEATINTTGAGVTEVEMPTSNIIQVWPNKVDVTFNEVSYPVFNSAWLVVRSQNTFRANETD
jgi:uncharacterized phage protein gp47/JayE